MDVSRSQPLVRNLSGASESSTPSGASTPHLHGDYATTRTYIPSHGYTASRLHNQSSFSTGTSQSPASSEAHEELASIPPRSASQSDFSTLRLTNAPDAISARRSHHTHGSRVLSHKDSFGGSYGLNAAAQLNAESADDSSTTFADHSQRLSSANLDDRFRESHHRNLSLSHAAQQPQRGSQTSTRTSASSNAGRSNLSGANEPIEVLQRGSAFSDLTSSQSSTFRSPSLSHSHSRTALSAAANAASGLTDSASTIDPADSTFAAGFDQALSLSSQDRDPPSTTDSVSVSRRRGPTMGDADLSSIDQDTLDLPAPSTTRSSLGSSATPLASRAGERDDDPTPSASSRELRQTMAPTVDSDSKLAARTRQAVPAPNAPQPKERRERSDKDKASTSDGRRAGPSRKGEAASSSSTRADATSSTGRPLKTSHRTLPQLPSAPNVRPAPPPAMYWSKAPVHGSVPRRSFRAHTGNLCDEVLWLFGGCDNRGCFRDLWCFDTETMCWSKPKVTGDIPPARRAHSATMVNKRLFVFAGGDGPHYFNDLYIFDTISLRWTKPEVTGTAPSPRRAHTCNYYEGQLIVFGGGNGVGALNDVYTLDVNDLSRLEWRKMDCVGKVPIGRGYHTSNLVDGKLIVIGGSDGHMSFNDIHILRIDTQTWYQVKTDEVHNRLGHTATQVGSYLFIFGGHDSKTYTSEVLTLNLVNLQWEPRKVCGKKPPGRGYHQAWLRDSRLFVHGGFDGKEIFDELHYLDLAACAYLPQITSFSVELDDEE